MYVYPNHYFKNFIIIFKKNSPYKYIIFFSSVNIRMINLSFDELRLIAQIRNVSNYENKSKEDLIKALSETKQTPKQEAKSKPEHQNQKKTKTRTRTKSRGKS